MAQSLSMVLLHLVFSTKNREPFISESVQDGLHAYLAGACRGQGSEAFRVGGTEDHVHIACTLPRTLAISELLEQIKRPSSRWMKERDRGCRDFRWQGGYGAFSLGMSQLDDLIAYIDKQKEHHKKVTFKEELRRLLEKYGVDYDERYVWD